MLAGRDYDLAARLEAVEDENDLLRERVKQLEEVLGFRFLPPAIWGLTGSEAAVVGCLLARDLATKEALHLATQRSGADEPSEPKIVDVYICKVRKKLRRFGIEITTRWGVGYELTPEMKAHARTFIDSEVEVAPALQTTS